jgi:hypothetical protein
MSVSICRIITGYYNVITAILLPGTPIAKPTIILSGVKNIKSLQREGE